MNRPYFFVRFNSGSWGFIATNKPYTSNLIQLEEWTVDDKKYIFCRVCYTKDTASQLVAKAQSGECGLMEGPDMYCVIDDDDDETILTIWKPQHNVIELMYDRLCHSVTDDAKLDVIKTKAKEMLELVDAKITILSTEYDHQL